MTSKLTREQLHERARENVKALKMASRQTAFESAREEILADLQLAELALAAMDSKPVAYTDEAELCFVNDMACMWTKGMGINEVPLYRHAQQPVAVTDDELNAALQLHRLKVDGHSQLSDAFRAGFRYARRTAPQPAPVVPEALEHLRSIVADPRLLPRRNEWISGQQYSYVLLEEVEAIVDDACRAAMLQAGSSPVIPDCSASMLRRWLAFGRGMQSAGSQLPHNLIAESEAMLEAAPQSPGSEPATVPGKWIPVSERMPEVGDIVLTAIGVGVTIGETECTATNCRFFTSVISGSELPATHWMPLPAGPQEVK